MAQFMLALMTDTAHKASLSPEEMRAVIAESSARAARMGAEGRLARLAKNRALDALRPHGGTLISGSE